MSVQKTAFRCAVYTRKSSEEGLEQSFNSLDAQREACEAYIASQHHEGWKSITIHYDDGGYSGGSMERPALKKLLEDVAAKKVDIIVVYKVDRLTRSLADFAKIVEILDASSVSFVSVTQQFNTTSSMGRLTLNVLLSFAQFEREVTGERIRDKIAASKRKGMWMGGILPLGYDLQDRKLVVNANEAKLVNTIFERYLQLGCVSKLKSWLDAKGATTRVRISAAGKRSGGTSYARGALYQILKNRIYRGEISHAGASYPGQHEAIVRREIWEQVEAKLKSDHQGRRSGLKAESGSLLTGRIFDVHGAKFTPSHSVKNGKRYRYYALRKNSARTGEKVTRFPAFELEFQVIARLARFLSSGPEVLDALSRPTDDTTTTKFLSEASLRLSELCRSTSISEVHEFVREVTKQVVVDSDTLQVIVNGRAIRNRLLGSTHDAASSSQSAADESNSEIRLLVDAKLRRNGMEVRLVVPPKDESPCRTVPSLLKAIARGHAWVEEVLAGTTRDKRSLARKLGVTERYAGRICETAFLAPDIVEAILRGRQPIGLTFQKLTNNLPMDWVEQRRILGFSAI